MRLELFSGVAVLKPILSSRAEDAVNLDSCHGEPRVQSCFSFTPQRRLINTTPGLLPPLSSLA